jgi:hypothetical protein
MQQSYASLYEIGGNSRHFLFLPYAMRVAAITASKRPAAFKQQAINHRAIYVTFNEYLWQITGHL